MALVQSKIWHADENVPTLEELIMFAFNIVRSRAQKTFRDYMSNYTDEDLTQRTIGALTPAFHRFLRQDPRKWTLEGLTKLVNPKGPSSLSTHKRGVYILLAAHFAYGGSRRVMDERHWHHCEHAKACIEGRHHQKSLFYDKCKEVGALPSFIHVMIDSFRCDPRSTADDHGVFLEILESIVLILMDLCPIEGTRSDGMRKLAAAARHSYLRTVKFEWTGANNDLPLSRTSAELKHRGALVDSECRHCNMSIPDHMLVEHLRDAHGDTDPPYNCPICDKAMLRESLRIHTLRHDKNRERPFECQECHADFLENWVLTDHMKFHSGLKPFKCDVCGKGFSKPGTRNRHVRDVHEGKKYVNTRDRPGRFRCCLSHSPDVQISFSTTNDHHDHMNKYHGVPRPVERKKLKRAAQNGNVAASAAVVKFEATLAAAQGEQSSATDHDISSEQTEESASDKDATAGSLSDDNKIAVRAPKRRKQVAVLSDADDDGFPSSADNPRAMSTVGMLSNSNAIDPTKQSSATMVRRPSVVSLSDDDDTELPPAKPASSYSAAFDDKENVPLPAPEKTIRTAVQPTPRYASHPFECHRCNLRTSRTHFKKPGDMIQHLTRTHKLDIFTARRLAPFCGREEYVR